MPGFNVVLGGAINPSFSQAVSAASQKLAEAALAAANTSGALDKISAATIPLQNNLRNFEAALKKATSAGETQYLQRNIDVLKASLDRLKNSGQQLVPGINQAQNALTNLGRVAQDAPFGFIGIQNNINPLLESFQRLKAETGTTGGAIKALIAGLSGGAGLGLAVSLATAGLTYLTQHGFFAASDAAKGFNDAVTASKKALEDATGNAAKESAQLQVLASIAADTTLTQEQRLNAVNKLQTEYPNYLGNLSKEALLTGNIKKELEALNAQILNKALAQAQESNIAKFASQLVEINQQVEKAKKQVAAAEDQLLTSSSNSGQFAVVAGLKSNLSDLVKTQTAIKKQIDDTINSLRGYTVAAGDAYGGAGKDAKNAGAILGDLNRKMDEFYNIQVATGADQTKSKISALKEAITDLLKAGIAPANTQLQSLITQFKNLGGSFDDELKKPKEAVDKIAEALQRLTIARDEVNKNPLLSFDEKDKQQFDLVFNAIKQLRELGLKQNSSILIKLGIEADALSARVEYDKFHALMQKTANEAVAVAIPVTLSLGFKTFGDLNKDEFANTLNAELVDIQKLTKKFNYKPIELKLKGLLFDKKAFDEYKKSLEDAFNNLNEDVGRLSQALAANIAISIGQGLGDAFSGKGFSSLFEGVFNTLGAGIKSFGEALIKYGTELVIVKQAFKSLNPVLAIGAGIALEALGTVVQNSIPRLASGAVVSAPTLALIGEYGNAKSDPEIVSPLSKLKQLLPQNNSNGGSMKVEVVGQISGGVIRLNQVRTNSSFNRIYGSREK